MEQSFRVRGTIRATAPAKVPDDRLENDHSQSISDESPDEEDMCCLLVLD